MKACICKNKNVMEDFVKIFRNKKYMKELYPKTYKAYKDTCKAFACSKGDVLDVAGIYGDDILEEFDIEVVHISYTDSTKKYVQVDIRAVAMDPKGYCILNISIPRIEEKLTATDKISLENVCCNFTGDQEEVSLQIPVEYFNQYVDKEGIEVVAKLYMVDSKVAAYESRELISLYGLNYSSTFDIKRPQRIHADKTNTDINISYRYKGGEFDKNLRDYFYSSEVLANGNLHIPSEGEIKVSGVNLDTSLPLEVRLMATNAAGKSLSHNNANASLSDNTITWNMPDDWGKPYNDILDNLYCYVTYQLEIKATGKGKPYTFVVTNREGAKAADNKKIIEKIRIYKDCFERGTLIKMEDGSEKEIENVHTGDMLSILGGADRVRAIQSVDMHVAMVYMKGTNKKDISVSINHPFMTDQGFVCAAFLKEGMEVHTEEGKTKIEELCVTPGVEITLYQIELEKCNKLYANGFLVGDSKAELTAEERINNLRYRVCKGWETDYDSWAKEKKIMTQHL